MASDRSSRAWPSRLEKTGATGGASTAAGAIVLFVVKTRKAFDRLCLVKELILLIKLTWGSDGSYI